MRVCRRHRRRLIPWQTLFPTLLFVIRIMLLDSGDPLAPRESVQWRRVLQDSCCSSTLSDQVSIDIKLWLRYGSLSRSNSWVRPPFRLVQWLSKIAPRRLEFAILDFQLDGSEMCNCWNNEHEFGYLRNLVIAKATKGTGIP